MKFLTLTKGKRAIVDDEDFEKANSFKWHFNNGYARVKNKKFNIYLHKLIFGKNVEVDHVNRNKLDCRKENLRECNRSQNTANQGLRRSNTSGFRGVSFDKKKKKWYAQINLKKNHFFLGYHKTPEEAAIAYRKKSRELFKEFSAV